MKMDEKRIMEGNIKLTVFNSFPYKRLQKVIDAVVGLGYDCDFVDNGNIVFTYKGDGHG